MWKEKGCNGHDTVEMFDVGAPPLKGESGFCVESPDLLSSNLHPAPAAYRVLSIRSYTAGRTSKVCLNPTWSRWAPRG
jgi:hypothetical protein